MTSVIKVFRKTCPCFFDGYLSSYSLLHSTQSGFRSNRICETYWLQMVNKWLYAINSCQRIEMVMIELLLNKTNTSDTKAAF